MESRSFGGGRPRGGRGKSNFGSRDYRMEGRREQNNTRGGGGGGGRYGNSGGSGGKKTVFKNLKFLFKTTLMIHEFAVIEF